MKKNKRIEIYLFKFRNRNHKMDKKFKKFNEVALYNHFLKGPSR
jgi:hypothetical protein